jgi:hypothetical protein
MFEIKKSRNHKFYFVFKAGNGEIVVTSEMYESKQSAKKGISALKKCFFASVMDNSDVPIRNGKGQFVKR